jgi:hypothetical protein
VRVEAEGRARNAEPAANRAARDNAVHE